MEEHRFGNPWIFHEIINIEKESTNILYYNVKKRREKIEENIFYKIRKLKTNAQK